MYKIKSPEEVTREISKLNEITIVEMSMLKILCLDLQFDEMTLILIWFFFCTHTKSTEVCLKEKTLQGYLVHHMLILKHTYGVNTLLIFHILNMVYCVIHVLCPFLHKFIIKTSFTHIFWTVTVTQTQKHYIWQMSTHSLRCIHCSIIN